MSNLPVQEPKRRRRLLMRWLAILLGPLAGIALWGAWLLATDNFHPIVEGQAYRAGQMTSNELTRCIVSHGIRSVINLRGENPDTPWYREEVAVTESLGIQHQSFRMASQGSVSVQRADELLALLSAAPKPVLIHCDGGADRAAFAAALYAAKIAGRPPEKAEREFSVWYGHWTWVWKKKARLRESFRAYMTNSQSSAAKESLVRSPAPPP